MRIDRRRFLLGASIGVASLGAPWAAARANAAMGADLSRHMLARTGFTPTPAEIARTASLEYGAALERLLTPLRADTLTLAPEWTGMRWDDYRRRIEESAARRREAQANVAEAKAGLFGKQLAVANVAQEYIRELRNWWVTEMLVTDQPLVERMTLFWHNHFVTSYAKARVPQMLWRQNATFRKHALGDFGALLRDVARDPAMLIYLDGVQNRVEQPNENFARELLELFTLGEGNYSERDVKEAARAFTGWSLDRGSGAFKVYPALHDKGEKSFLGHRGRFDGDDILAILLKHPRTAETVVEKLWREFVSLEPHAGETKRLAAVFRDSGYQMKPLLRAMFTSEAFLDPAGRGGLIKSPVDLVVGTVRLLGLPVPEKTRLNRALLALGQLPFDPPNVKGWPGGTAWINAQTLLLRQQILRRIVEATTVAPMGGGPMTAARGEAMEELPTMEATPVEGRSLRDAGQAARLGPTLLGLDAPALRRAILATAPRGAIEPATRPGEAVAQIILDPAYQLK